MRTNKVNEERDGNDEGGEEKVHDEYGRASGRGGGREGPCFIQKRDQEEKFEGCGNVDAQNFPSESRSLVSRFRRSVRQIVCGKKERKNTRLIQLISFNKLE